MSAMREILFRGKRADNGKWEFGSLSILPNGDYQIGNSCVNPPDGDPMWHKVLITHKVIPETVGQFTGLVDKNGKKIFEGDIVDVAYDSNYVGTAKHRIGLFKVVFHNGCFMKKKIMNSQMSFFEQKESVGYYHFIPSDETEIVGDTYNDESRID